MTKLRNRIACWITKVTNTLMLCNIHCFSAAKMVATTRLIVTLYVQWLSYYYFVSDEMRVYNARVFLFFYFLMFAIPKCLTHM